MGNLYKILLKVPTNRLWKVVGRVAFYSQNAFVEGGQILDAALVANKVVDSRLKSGSYGVLCKFDIEKVYDHVNCSFLLVVLVKSGLGGLNGKFLQQSALILLLAFSITPED